MVIKNSKLDYLPLVNAIGAGKELGFETGYGAMRYLLPNEVKQISDGLLQLTEKGFQDRFRRESKQSIPCPWIDWLEEEMWQWLTDYYIDILPSAEPRDS